MNDRNKHKVTGQMNQQTADPKADASVFLFFANTQFKTILANDQMTHLVFTNTQTNASKNQKSHFYHH